MRSGISSSSSSEDRAKINHLLEQKGQLESDVSAAQVMGEEWVETSPEVIKLLNPQGLGKQKYFIYKNINVCEFGTRDAIIKSITDQMTSEQTLHGGSGTFEGTIMGEKKTKPLIT